MQGLATPAREETRLQSFAAPSAHEFCKSALLFSIRARRPTASEGKHPAESSRRLAQPLAKYPRLGYPAKRLISEQPNHARNSPDADAHSRSRPDLLCC